MDLLLLFLDHRRGRFAVDIAAGLLALDHDCVVASDGAHTDRRAAAAPTALERSRTVVRLVLPVSLRTVDRVPPSEPRVAAPPLSEPRVAAAPPSDCCPLLPAASGPAPWPRLCARTRLGTGLLCLRELEAIRGRIGRSGGSQTDRRCGSDNKSKYPHSGPPLEYQLPEKQSAGGDAGFRAARCFLMYGRSSWSRASGAVAPGVARRPLGQQRSGCCRAGAGLAVQEKSPAASPGF